MRYRANRPAALLATMLLALAAGVARGEETLAAGTIMSGTLPDGHIYVSTGSSGELSFSDVAAPGAQQVELVMAAPLEDPAAELARRVEQTLRVADALEASRLEREEARLKARQQALAAGRAAPPPAVVYQERYVGAPFLLRPQGQDRRVHGRRNDGHDRHERGRPDRGRPDRGRPDTTDEGDRSRSRRFVYERD